MSTDSKTLVSSATALKIFREKSGRATANRRSLKAHCDTGEIVPVKIHCRKFAYDPAQVAEVAARLAGGAA